MKVYKTKEELTEAVDDYLGMKGRFVQERGFSSRLSYFSPSGVELCRFSICESDQGWRVNDYSFSIRILTELIEEER
jgi:hypothetical protein